MNGEGGGLGDGIGLDRRKVGIRSKRLICASCGIGQGGCVYGEVPCDNHRISFLKIGSEDWLSYIAKCPK